MIAEENGLITALPTWQKKNIEDQEIIETPSYRHVAKIDVNHYYLFEEKLSGNQQFANQLKNLDGLFDYRDALFDREYAVASEEFQTLIPMVNTLEIAWDNQLIRKTPKEC